MFWELWHNGECRGKVKILTGDRDLFQLIDPQKEVSVCISVAPLSSEAAPVPPVGLEQVKEKLGILPSQVVDYWWDKSDNILGVKGIGEKTAVDLLTTTPSTIFMPRWLRSRELLQKLEAGKTLPITPAIWLISTRCPFRC